VGETATTSRERKACEKICHGKFRKGSNIKLIYQAKPTPTSAKYQPHTQQAIPPQLEEQ